VVESPHPYPPGHRVVKRTLTFPGASHVALCFDPRCSTPNGNDQLRLFYGAINSHAMACFHNNLTLTDVDMKFEVENGVFYGSGMTSLQPSPQTRMLRRFSLCSQPSEATGRAAPYWCAAAP